MSVPGNDLNYLSHLPPLHLKIVLPDGYPAICPPTFDLSTSPSWLSDEVFDRLRADGERLWEEFGHDQVVFAFIDHLQQAAENAFGVLSDTTKNLEISQDHKIALLDYNIKAERAAFEKETFDCGICLDPKKGSACHRMIECGHVFCVQCLQDFYTNAITEGDLATVRCLAPNCAKERDEASQKRRKRKVHISPSELLQIPLGQDLVKRYVTLKHKVELESDKNTVWCPRKWCQGAARSKKHRKPEGLEVIESSGEDSDDDSSAEKTKKEKYYGAGDERIAICEDCSYAFCSRCLQGWHGEFVRCGPPRNTAEMTEEEKASLEYIRLHTSLCPTCAAPAQKTHGCNHMICFKCDTHFCYLCSAWLEPKNPYQHFNMEKTGCYMRLWELEGGDGADVDRGYAGGLFVQREAEDREDRGMVAWEDPWIDDGWNAVDDSEEEEAGGGGGGGEEPIEEANRDNIQPAAVARAPVARLAPLVIQLFDEPRARPQPVAAVPAQRQQPVPRPPRRHAGRGQVGAAAGARAAPAQAAHRRAAPRPAVALAPARVLVGPNRDAPIANPQEADQRAWIQNFVQMALNDEEDLVDWDSDDEEDIGAWEIPVR